MAKNPEKVLKRLLRDNEMHRKIQNAMLILSLFVILGVFWSLKLTGITMAGEAFCGKDEHAHGDNCPTGILVCQLVESKPHTHTENCIYREMICSEEAREGHAHTEDCSEKQLLCTQQSMSGHVHEDSCLDRILVCEEEERSGHTHGDGCWEISQICTQEEREGHTHADACWESQLTCTLPETEPHTHGAECHSTQLVCTLPEDEIHTHGEECHSTELICTISDGDSHAHGSECRTAKLICETEEDSGHFHGDSCFEKKLLCDQQEDPGHTHGSECYVVEQEDYVCGIHVHTAECYGEEVVHTCGLEEDPGHAHDETCYQLGIGFGCGLTEADGHVHTQECVTGETQISCGMEATEGHTHAEDCYETLEQCPLEAHVHEESCYSDIQADLETEDDWEMSLAGLTRSAITAENVVTVARSQLGCGESTLNFQVDANGVRRGITRYGQWYGNPYGDWSGMFASFCLYYAGVADVPANAGPEAMRLEWEQAGYYIPAEEYSPRYGDLLFLHIPESEEEASEMEAAVMVASETETAAEAEAEETAPAQPKPSANAVAIITGFDGSDILVIQGDLDGVVAETSYPADDPVVLGYGMVPEDPTYAVLVTPPAGAKVVAQTTSYNTNNFTENNCFVLYTTSNGMDYAIDGAGNAVPIYVDAGKIYSELENDSDILWTFNKADGTNNWVIQNVGSGRYLHAFTNNGGGVTTTGAYSSNVTNNTAGMLVRSNREYARLDLSQNKYVVTQNQSLAARYKLGMTSPYTVWLDGTGGGQGQLGGSLNQKYTVSYGETLVLPQEWQVPEKYDQRLRGWYDVTNQKYYAPGSEVTVTDNMVFYADWTAATYDIGRYNAQVTDTISTSSFITTHVFDYNYLFNVMSANATVNVNASGHTETWRMVEDGTVDYKDQQSLEFVFVDYDGSSRLPDMAGRNNANNYLGVGIVTPGIYTPELADILFSTGNALNPQTGEGIIGKTYVGTADHLFQFMDDPADEHYGYYYYDSHRNAASYNQSAGRFYVYDYLEATSDSLNSDNRSDFLPFNSPYANTNGNMVRTYTDAGLNGEYQGVNHFRYDSKYSDNNNGTDYVSTNYAFGMRMDVDFYLPNAPGTRDADGNYGNQDLYGNDMHFQFKGDDDVWVLVDGRLVLDIGGIHGVEGGDINFATGVVTVNGEVDAALSAELKKVTEGEHVLTFMYLERGSSQSNCAFFFNLAPRFSLAIQKEDVLTQELLNGAQFSVFRDKACTVPAQLWESQAAHDSGAEASNIFTVQKGVANMWGFASGNTYYIKETKPPDAVGYGFANGIIRLTIDKDGIATYDVEIIEDGDTPVSNGFTVHGIRIDEQTQSAYIVATNAPEWVKEVTTVQTMKQWNDDLDHANDYVTVYLTVTDSDGTVRRIREVLLSQENDWHYAWTNLPKYAADGVTPIQYGIEEAYVPGYQGQVKKVDAFTIVTEKWAEAFALKNGQTYILGNGSGYLSTTGAGADTGYKWVDEKTAKSSSYALWMATASGETFKLTNQAGQTITFYYGGGSPTDFFSSTGGESNNSKQYFKVSSASGGIRLYYDAPNGKDYYLASSLNSSKKFGYSTTDSGGMILVPMTKVTDTHTETVTGIGFQINNTPLEDETSVEVLKKWQNSLGDDPTLYQTEQVTIRLLANGQDTGRTVTLNLKNGWKDTFRGLPAKDENGNRIVYTVEESWLTEDWVPIYGEIISSGTENPTYTTTVTNVYRVGGPELPSTGTAARMMYILCGAGIMLSSLVYGITVKCRRERRRK